MDQREIVRVEIEESRAALAAKINALEHRATDLRTRARDAVDVRHQTYEHPWKVFGAAVTAGFLLGVLSS